MRLLSYWDTTGAARAAIRNEDQVFDAAALLGDERFRDMLEVIRAWQKLEPLIAGALADAKQRTTAARLHVDLAPPVNSPIIYCAGANYAEHVRVITAKMGIPSLPDPRTVGLPPFHFVVPPGSIAGPDETIPIPAYAKMFDWEIELAAVIGRPTTNVSVADALQSVFGYTIGCDLTCRDNVRAAEPAGSPFRADSISAKGFTKSCPIGPEIVLAKDVATPQSLGLRLWVDDELMQNSSTSDMIFSVAEQIAHLSTRVTLMPGDLIMTGTPEGTGAERGIFLKSGQQLRLQIDGLGELRNKVI